MTVALLTLCTTAFSLTITVDPAIRYQEFEGWGTSLCWWAITAGSWKKEIRTRLVGAIVDPDTGLGYTCFRYNIGGGDSPSHTHLKGERAVPGFKPTEQGDYDWNADPYQRNILLEIARQCPSAVFEAFSNSPPWWMTISGCASGNTNGADNLKPAYFTAFADYLATVVKHYRDEWDITFRTVEPFNEPSSGYWKINGGQEGCGFKNNQSEMVIELGRKLAEKGLFPGTSVSAADETSLAHTVTSIKAYDDSALQYLSQINSHSYGGWESRNAVFTLAQERQKNLWQSESGPLDKKDNSDITMWMSNVIIQDLRGMKPNAWIDWQVCDPVADWQTIGLNGTAQTFTYTKRYYMHAAFSRFIRPGSRIIYSSDANSVAALVPSREHMVVIVRNSASQAADYTIDLSKTAVSATAAEIHRFALPASLTLLDDLPIADSRLAFTAPGRTITTIVIPQPVASGNKRMSTSGLKEKFTIFPHNGRLRVIPPSRAPYRFGLYSPAGRKILDFQGGSETPSIDINLNQQVTVPGLYLAVLRQNDGTYLRRISCVSP